MVFRIYSEKKKEHAFEAAALLREIKSFLKIESVRDVRIINRYDAENISREIFDYAAKTVFSEPQLDDISYDIDTEGKTAFAVEYLPGQFDQRADSAAQCIQLLSMGERPLIKSAKVYILSGEIGKEELRKIKEHVINPVEAREASFDLPETLKEEFVSPAKVKTIDGFIAFSDDELREMIKDMGLAMDFADICFCRDYFRKEDRDPTVTEIRMIDTYWSDHCRHTTFLTDITSVKFEDELLEKTYADYLKTRQELGRTKPVCLMDIATIAVRHLKKEGKLDKLDESEEINACTVKIEIEADGKKEPWLLLFKNETHNHPTEIEPFGGAATCIGGAIRDPLSGRSYVYGAMRVTGAADPTADIEKTIPGKLPQRKIVTTAAAGYSSYGNQIGLATGIVDEIYHPGYAAKRMEIGAVIAAAPAENVKRERPIPGDVVILLGGRTGRDGIGGATGSSKAHNVKSVETCSAEVQKGNAPEERKLQRLFRNADACRMIKRCNDFGAGGVSVAIGELADGLDIDLSLVPKKYEGLDGTELAISESQERMAVVVAKEDVSAFLSLAESENLMATPVAKVKEDRRLTMTWNGDTVVDISRDFLDSNGASKSIEITAAKCRDFGKETPSSFADEMKKYASDLNLCSKRGLSERFDSTIGAGTVLMPFGGVFQRTPIQAMVQKISVEKKHTNDVSLMSWGYNPFISEKSPYHGAYLAVVESVSKLIATGAEFRDVYLTFQEYFEKPGNDGKRWGKPLSALLGAYRAQMDLGIGSIGGKDSMSGSFEDIDVPPTLVSFAVTTGKTDDIISPEFKLPTNSVYLLKTQYDENGLPNTESLISNFDKIYKANKEGNILSCCALTSGGIAEAVFKMCLGNGLGFRYDQKISLKDIFDYAYGSFIFESVKPIDGAVLLGEIRNTDEILWRDEAVSLRETEKLYEDRLEDVYPCNISFENEKIENFAYDIRNGRSCSVKSAKPKVIIPAFPGTNCEYDSAKTASDAGMDSEIFVLNNLSSDGIKRSVEAFASKIRSSQMIFIPGGFSSGDEPDGSAKFITAFFRNGEIKKAVTELLDNREGLICGICNGFQALIKLGLVPYGKIIDTDENCPTLTFNKIARHQSKIVRTRVASVKSPFFAGLNVGDIISVPISHGEGRFIANDASMKELAANGQIATQYADIDGNATYDVQYNPNGSLCAVEGITSPDGRVLGKMGHSERIGENLYLNVPGNYDSRIFVSAVKYFK